MQFSHDIYDRANDCRIAWNPDDDFYCYITFSPPHLPRVNFELSIACGCPRPILRSFLYVREKEQIFPYTDMPDFLNRLNDLRLWGEEKAITHKTFKGSDTDILLQALQDPYAEQRYYAASSLDRFGNTRAVEPLIRALNDIDFRVRTSAKWALATIGDSRAIEPLLRHFNEGDGYDWEMCAKALGSFRDERVIEALLNKLNAPFPGVRANCAIALGNFAEPRAAAPLIDALSDEEGFVNLATIEALGKIGDPKAMQPMLDILTSSFTVPERVQIALINSIGKLGDPQAIDPLKHHFMYSYKQVRAAIDQAIKNLST